MSDESILRWHFPSRDQVEKCTERQQVESRASRSMPQVASAALQLARDPNATSSMSDAEFRATFAPGARRRQPISSNQLMLLARTGLPAPPPAGVTVKDYVISLLKIAAEVEHALMAQYLFTAFSIDPAGSQASTGRDILSVAVQEMGHLCSVQNLLLLVGGPDVIYLQRDVMRKASDLNPIPFVLEKLSLEAVAKYLAAEMPDTIPSAIATQVATYTALANASSGVQLHRVGAIYTLLQWILMDEAAANAWIDLTSLAGFPVDFHLQDSDITATNIINEYGAGRDEWKADDVLDFILSVPQTRGDAVSLLESIAEQGEGWSSTVDSHFERFFNLAEAIQAGGLNSGVYPLVKSPTLQAGLGGDNGTVITDPYTLLWGQVFALQYTLLVLSINHALRTSLVGQPTLRQELVDLAFDGMRRYIGRIAKILAQLPISPGSQAMSGPPFDLNPADLEVHDVSDFPAKHKALLIKLDTVYSQILATMPTIPITHSNMVTNLKAFDAKRLALFP